MENRINHENSARERLPLTLASNDNYFLITTVDCFPMFTHSQIIKSKNHKINQ